MKKLFVAAAALLLGANVSHAQATGGSTDTRVRPGVTSLTSGKKGANTTGKKAVMMEASGKKALGANASGKKALGVNATGKKALGVNAASGKKSSRNGTGGAVTPEASPLPVPPKAPLTTGTTKTPS